MSHGFPAPPISIFNSVENHFGMGSVERVIYVKLHVTMLDLMKFFSKGKMLNVFLTIALHMQENHNAFPSQDVLLRILEIDKDTLTSALNLLCQTRINGQRVMSRETHRKANGQWSGTTYFLFPTAAQEKLSNEEKEWRDCQSDFYYTKKRMQNHQNSDEQPGNTVYVGQSDDEIPSVQDTPHRHFPGREKPGHNKIQYKQESNHVSTIVEAQIESESESEPAIKNDVEKLYEGEGTVDNPAICKVGNKLEKYILITPQSDNLKKALELSAALHNLADRQMTLRGPVIERARELLQEYTVAKTKGAKLVYELPSVEKPKPSALQPQAILVRALNQMYDFKAAVDNQYVQMNEFIGRFPGSRESQIAKMFDFLADRKNFKEGYTGDPYVWVRSLITAHMEKGGQKPLWSRHVSKVKNVKPETADKLKSLQLTHERAKGQGSWQDYHAQNVAVYIGWLTRYKEFKTQTGNAWKYKAEDFSEEKRVKFTTAIAEIEFLCDGLQVTLDKSANFDPLETFLGITPFSSMRISKD